MSAAPLVLDRVHSLGAVAALAADPGAYLGALERDLAAAPATLAGLEARDAALRAALGAIDALAARAMRLQLDHALAADASIAPVTRNVFATTIVSYAGSLERLADRAADVAARGGARDPGAVAGSVVGAARTVLALRDRLRAGVLELARDLAAASAPDADRLARDRRLEAAPRTRWGQARRDLEAVAADPSALVGAPMAARMAAYPAQLDEPPAEAEPTFVSMIELD